MEGKNTLKLCLAETKRLLEIALRHEGFLKGDFTLEDIRLDKSIAGPTLEIDIAGHMKAAP